MIHYLHDSQNGSCSEYNNLPIQWRQAIHQIQFNLKSITFNNGAYVTNHRDNPYWITNSYHSNQISNVYSSNRWKYCRYHIIQSKRNIPTLKYNICIGCGILYVTPHPADAMLNKMQAEKSHEGRDANAYQPN